MPRLFEKFDGTFVIRTYAGDDDDGFHGTWQISARGIDALRQARICHDGDEIPMPLFRELRGRRLIWTETGYMGRRWVEPSPAPESPRIPVSPPQSTPRPSPFVRPRMRFVLNPDLSWHVAASFAFLRDPHFAQVAQRIRAVIAAAEDPTLSIGATHVPLRERDPEDPFRDLMPFVLPQREPYEVILRGRRQRPLRIGEMHGLEPQGTFFTYYSGRRIAVGEPLEWGETYYIVMQTLHHYDNPLLQAVPPQRLALRAPWIAYRVRLPNEPDTDVLRHVAGLGHAPRAKALA